MEVQPQDITSSSAVISWREPSLTGQPGIAAYQITAMADSGTVTFTSTNNDTSQTIIGLLPGTRYSFTVRAIAMSGAAVARGNASEPVYANTSVTSELIYGIDLAI